jgi:hypothetical protein
MNPPSLDPIADFIRKGGRIVKLQQTIPVTGPEVLDYLMNCGLSAAHSPGNSRLYLCKGRVLSLRKLIKVANEYRSQQQLPPFVARI